MQTGDEENVVSGLRPYNIGYDADGIRKNHRGRYRIRHYARFSSVSEHKCSASHRYRPSRGYAVPVAVPAGERPTPTSSDPNLLVSDPDITSDLFEPLEGDPLFLCPAVFDYAGHFADLGFGRIEAGVL